MLIEIMFSTQPGNSNGTINDRVNNFNLIESKLILDLVFCRVAMLKSIAVF